MSFQTKEDIRYSQAPPVFVSTVNEIPGYEIVEYLGVVFGITVRARGLSGRCLGGYQSYIKEKITTYTTTA